jgi:hypothetical protein
MTSNIREMGSGHANYLKLLKNNHKNTLILALYRTFQGQKEDYSHLVGVLALGRKSRIIRLMSTAKLFRY